jgi:hypothetical protein
MVSSWFKNTQPRSVSHRPKEDWLVVGLCGHCEDTDQGLARLKIPIIFATDLNINQYLCH